MDKLRNDCCLCYNKGEIDLFAHKVILDNFNIDDTDERVDENNEINAMELFEIYKDVDMLSLNEELKLICQPCLQELIMCYKFYRKIISAFKQKQQLYETAQTYQSQQLDDLIIEVFETEESSQAYEEQIENDKNCEEALENRHLETTSSNIEMNALTQDECFVTTPIDITQTESNLMPQVDVIVDLNEINEQSVNAEESCIALPEDDSINSADCETISFDENIIYQSDHEKENEKDEIKPPDQKRPRLKFLREKLGLTGPVQPPHEDASLVVTQFLPVKTQMRLETHLVDSDSNNYESSLSECQDLSTVDYAAVEIKSSNFQHTDNGELELQTHDLCNDDSKEQIFVCKYCPQAFAAAPYLVAHVRKSHVCKYCTKAFAKSLDLYVHIRQAHYQHKCAICHKELSSQSNLRGHIKRVHGIRLPAQVALLDYKTPNSEAGI